MPCIATDKRGIHVIFFLFLHKYICCGYSLEAPPRSTSEYPYHIFSWRNKKDISIFWMKKVPYLLLCRNMPWIHIRSSSTRLMSTHYIPFRGEIRKIFIWVPLFFGATAVCVEVLWPGQPNGVMSSAVSLLNHTFTGQA